MWYNRNRQKQRRLGWTTTPLPDRVYTPVIIMQITYEFIKSKLAAKAPLNYTETQHYMNQVNEESERVLSSLSGEPDIFFHIFTTSHAYLNDMLKLLPESPQTYRFSPSFMAGSRESFINFVDYFYLKSNPNDIPMKEKHLKDSTKNPSKSMPNKWHKTKTLQEMFESIAKAENVSIPHNYIVSDFYSTVSKQIHNDSLDIHKMNVPENKELFFLASRAFYFIAMSEYGSMLWEEYRKKYNKIPSICKDINYLSRKTFM